MGKNTNNKNKKNISAQGKNAQTNATNKNNNNYSSETKNSYSNENNITDCRN